MKDEAFDSLVRFLVASVSPDDTSSFSPTPAAQERLESLAKVTLRGSLTREQQRGLEQVIQLERWMQLAKARRACQKRNNVPSPTSPSVVSDRETLPYRCEYCLMHDNDTYFALSTERIVPTQHGGTSSLDNRAYVCAECRLRRGAEIASQTPGGKMVALFNPRLQRWGAHFCIEDGSIEPLTRIGEVTVHHLDLNDAMRVETRLMLAEQKLYPRR